MTNAKTLDPDTLRRVLRYDAGTGKLYWRERPGNARFNNRFAGREAFTAFNSEGYRVGRVFNIYLRAHRVIWAMVHDEWPEQIDHENHDCADNRLSNLSRATNQSNQRNVPLCRNNTSGRVGVTLHRQTGKWVAFIWNNRRRIYLGLYADKADAIAARARAERELGFAASHGAPRKRVA